MARKIVPYSLAFRLALFFARNPEEELTSADVVTKFDVPPDEVSSRLSRAVRDELLSKSGATCGRGRLATYCAGPVLLALLDERNFAKSRAIDCFPPMGGIVPLEVESLARLPIVRGAPAVLHAIAAACLPVAFEDSQRGAL